MKHKIILILILFLSVVALTPNNTFAQKEGDRIIAIIGNDIILESDLQYQVQSYMRQNQLTEINPAMAQQIFQQMVNERIIIATIDALREGVDAIGFSMTLFAEIDWRGWAIEQAKGRTRRIGQEKNVRWVYFFFDRGVDRLMRKKIVEKNELAEAVRGTA